MEKRDYESRMTLNGDGGVQAMLPKGWFKTLVGCAWMKMWMCWWVVRPLLPPSQLVNQCMDDDGSGKFAGADEKQNGGCVTIVVLKRCWKNNWRWKWGEMQMCDGNQGGAWCVGCVMWGVLGAMCVKRSETEKDGVMMRWRNDCDWCVLCGEVKGWGGLCSCVWKGGCKWEAWWNGGDANGEPT